MRTQVAIVGAGPAGLILGQLLHGAGIDTVILERRSRDYVLGRIRAGVLEQGTVELLHRAGVGHRLDAEGLVHHGIELSFDGSRHRVDLFALSGRAVTVYGQTEMTRDLMEARAACGAPTVYEATDVALHDFDGERPRVSYVKDGARTEIDCDFIAGCDGFHGVSRASVPAGATRPSSASIPSAGSGSSPTCRRSSDELIYANHARGFALCSMRSPTPQPLLSAMPLDERVEDWPDDALLGRAAPAPRPDAAEAVVAGPSIEKIDRAPAQLRRRADALRPAVPRRRRGAHRAADRRQGPQSRRQRRVLSLRGAARASTASGSDAGLDALFRARAGAGLEGERFSWWMTTLLHRFPDDDAFAASMQRGRARLSRRLAGARSTALAENYIGLPY